MIAPDRYTKAVLTLIALALVYLCAVSAPIATPAHAQASPTHVVIAGWYDSTAQRVVPLTSAQGIPVLAGTALATVVPPATAPAAASTTPRALVSTPSTTSTPARQATSTRCQATTKAGAQCKRPARAAGSNYCWQHGG